MTRRPGRPGRQRASLFGAWTIAAWAITALLAGSLPGLARAQHVPLATGIPDACSQIPVQANLVLGEVTTVSGRVVDQHGRPLQHTPVSLRWLLTPTRESPRQSTETDADGRFAFRKADPGPYRLLAAPDRTFAQPGFLNCRGRHCHLDIELAPARTDAPDTACPLR